MGDRLVIVRPKVRGLGKRVNDSPEELEESSESARCTLGRDVSVESKDKLLDG